MAISPNQKTKMATVDFITIPACFTLDRNKWSFEILDDESDDVKNNDNDNGNDDYNDIIPKAPSITIDTHFKGICKTEVTCLFQGFN
jgi:hypothetical protein